MKVETMANKFFIVKPNGRKFVCFVDVTKARWSKYTSDAWFFSTKEKAEEVIAMIRKIRKLEGRPKTQPNEQTATRVEGK